MADSPDADRRDALTSRLFDATIGALELLSVHLGWRLGLYEELARSGPATATQLAAETGIAPRYAREWLEQQSVAGFLDADDAADADERRFSLPAAHVEVLVDADSPAHVAPFAPMLVGIAGAVPDVVDAYRGDTGVPYARYGPDFREGQARINRPAFVNDMASWLAASEQIHRRLAAEPGARIADVGCGLGYSTVAIARAYPGVTVEGLDLDEASIMEAEQRTLDADVAQRVSFAVRDAADLAAMGPYDLVCVFEALHDMARPVEMLSAAVRALAPDGSILVVDERVAEGFQAPGDEIERMMYGWSVLHCLPASKAEEPSAALGTVLRASTVHRLAEEAGITHVEVLPVANDFFRFYRLVP